MKGVTPALAAKYEEQNADAEIWLEDAHREPVDPAACRDIWIAVIADAFDLAAQHVSGVPRDDRTDWGRKASLERRRAYLWLTSRAEGVGTLRWVCASLGYDSDAVQEKVLRRMVA